jgi:hypothetical protein
MHKLAHMINNQAFTYVLIGQLDQAIKLSDGVIKQHTETAPPYYRALFYNTNALINIRRNQYERAQESVTRAPKAAEMSDKPRAIGLVKWAAATLDG